ncbi:MAG: 3'-5' exonuclease, partial [Lewinellaceae bacterium]|nr:3'-5' exonuclease [Lewinellaceae bacterium]
MYLFFDTETTGLPRNWNAPVTNTANWPRMVQLAWMLYDYDGRLVESDNHIIYPEGYTIPREVSALHGITTERAKSEGEALDTILELFETLL